MAKIHQMVWFCLLMISVTHCYKILVIPYSTGFNSRLLNVQKIADILATDGHEVHVLLNNRVRQHTIVKHSKVIEFKVPEAIKGVGDINLKYTSIMSLLNGLDIFLGIELDFTKHFLADKAAWKILEEANFDLIFSDVSSFSCQIISTQLNVPTIFYLNFLATGYGEFFYPVFPSFICVAPGMTCIDEDMTFSERVGNMAFKLIWDYSIRPNLNSRLEQLAHDNGIQLRTPLTEIWKRKIVVINAHYAMDTPMPTMPHVFPIPGLFHKKPNPLSKEIADIVKASEPHGTILLSFGTLISDWEDEKANMFARVFGRLPNQIIWKFLGPTPTHLKPNTHLVEWFPQNDLLANPSIKLFITHCGISSTFESSLHGVPVLAMPLQIDQAGNAAKLTKRLKMGVTLDYNTITEQELENTIIELLSNQTYEENAKKASYLLNDHVIPPQQQLRHLVNFTIKSGGAPHLFHPYALDMNWFQFYGLDLILCLFSVLAGTIVFLCAFIRFGVKMFVNVCRTKKSKQA